MKIHSQQMYEYYDLNQNRKTNQTIKNNTLHEF
jgi:hypothetical protein